MNMNPSVVVPMCGKNYFCDDPDEIENKIVNLVLKVNENAEKVVVSSILHRGDSYSYLKVKRKNVNRLVEDVLDKHEID